MSRLIVPPNANVKSLVVLASQKVSDMIAHNTYAFQSFYMNLDKLNLGLHYSKLIEKETNELLLNRRYDFYYGTINHFANKKLSYEDSLKFIEWAVSEDFLKDLEKGFKRFNMRFYAEISHFIYNYYFDDGFLKLLDHRALEECLKGNLHNIDNRMFYNRISSITEMYFGRRFFGLQLSEKSKDFILPRESIKRKLDYRVGVSKYLRIDKLSNRYSDNETDEEYLDEEDYDYDSDGY